MNRRILIGGNWKLQVNNLKKGNQIFQEIDNFSLKHQMVDTFVAVPSPFLYNIQGKYTSVACQNFCRESTGPYTGEVSIESLIESDISYSLIGHSERRIIFRESDESINHKIRLAFENSIKPVLCIGETRKERNEGKYESVIYNQLTKALKNVPKKLCHNLVIAYEPVWAINNKLLNPEGKIEVATTSSAQEAHELVRGYLAELLPEISESIRVIYGGSMNKSNAKELLSKRDIDGGLIGTASINAEEFNEIIKIASMKSS